MAVKTCDEKLYLTMLLGQYRLIDDARKSKAPKAVAAIDDIIKNYEQTGTIFWENLYCIDKALISFLNREEMECRLFFIIDMYREIAGEKNLANRMKVKTTDLKNINDETLLGELEELIDDMYRHLALYAACRKRRSRVLGILTIVMSVFYVGVISWMFRSDGNTPPILYVIAAGSIGGMISMIRRLQNLSNTDTHVLSYIDLKSGWLNICLAPVYGGVFSVVLFLFFTAGFLKGDIFPLIETMVTETAGEAETVSLVMSNFVVNTFPASGADCAKLIVWSFIAGFAERFVPDTIDRLMARSQKETGKK